MSIEWDQYRDRYRQRPETFDAYVDVWTHVPEAQQEFSGWAVFSQSAGGQPQFLREKPDYVARAERLMPTRRLRAGAGHGQRSATVGQAPLTCHAWLRSAENAADRGSDRVP